MKYFRILLLTGVLFSCHNSKNLPDVSGIQVTVQLERFERDFFTIDTNNIISELATLKLEHPDFYFDFMGEILGVDGMDSSRKTITATKEFLRSYYPVYDILRQKFENMEGFRKELENHLRYVIYYFPQYKAGKVFTFIGPFDAPGTALTRHGFAIGLQQYGGRNFSIYQNPQILEIYPTYISRRFDPSFMAVNCIKLITGELFPEKSKGKPLIEQMIEKGKQWWLLDKFLPRSEDSLKTGYTKMQLDWCRENEGLIWSSFIKNENLNSVDPASLQNYLGEEPFTQGFSQEYSPGNLGQWLGWQIVKKYAEKNSELKPGEIMQTDARKILEEAKYKPK